MPIQTTENRRANERRIDKITMKARTMAGTLKRTIGSSAAKRYLEKNGFGEKAVEEILVSSVERRCSRRRADNGPVSAPTKRAKSPPTRKQEIIGSLSASALYRLRFANDTKSEFIRVCDCPPQFARFGFMEPGLRGAHITERGRAALLHWTRAKALLAVSCGQGIEAYEAGVEIWLSTNRFIEVRGTQVVITPRGAEWLASRRHTLEELDQL